MATAQVSQNRVYLFRLQTLIIDGGTTVVRNIFDEKSANVPLNILLHNEKATINRLRAGKTITRTQFYLLYPQSGQFPTTADFDITLSICLLRNLKCCGLNKHFAWNAIPQAGDTSLEADICRLRMFRNDIAHISSTTSITQNTFTHKWLEIEQVLNRLNTCVQNPVQNLQQQFNAYKNSPLDEEAEKRIDGEIKKWRKFEKGLESEMQLVKKDVQEVKHEVGNVKEDVHAVKEKVDNVKEDVHAVKEKVDNVKEDVHAVKEKVDIVKEEVHDVAEKVDAVQEKIDELENEKRAQGGSKKAVGKAPNIIQRVFERIYMPWKIKSNLALDHSIKYNCITVCRESLWVSF
ncbi:E3 ubiquitin-protein ligase DZIP3-like [Mercenaria mercenaria]|uniref:E3 ubiquitin-protein ligase DZIP3-like n=1 Tax=Mercenaria mercenaria TaxID=6596 RepID=UPI00234ED227|nr:E3 ubiquitin-protein ligase DZIP3-like [Mercenaria mercenaria]